MLILRFLFCFLYNFVRILNPVTSNEAIKTYRYFILPYYYKIKTQQWYGIHSYHIFSLLYLQGDKVLMLKKRYFPMQEVGYYTGQMSPGPSSPSPSISGSMLSISQESLLDSPSRVPPPYRPPPPPVSSPRYSPQGQPPPPAYVLPPSPMQMVRHVEGQECDPDLPPPPVPPRRRSSDKGNKENFSELNKRPKTEGEEAPDKKVEHFSFYFSNNIK